MGISLLMISIYRMSLGGEYLPQLPRTSTQIRLKKINALALGKMSPSKQYLIFF